MQIVLNGETRECNDNVTLLELIKSLGIETKVMAAAINMEIVKQQEWQSRVLVDGDKIELLDFVGGG